MRTFLLDLGVFSHLPRIGGSSDGYPGTSACLSRLRRSGTIQPDPRSSQIAPRDLPPFLLDSHGI